MTSQWNSEQSESEESDISDSQSECSIRDDHSALKCTARKQTKRIVKDDASNSSSLSFGIDMLESASNESSASRKESLKVAPKRQKRVQSKLQSDKENEDEVMTFTVDSLTSQWDSHNSEREESDDSDSQSKLDIIISTKKSGAPKVHTANATLAITPLLPSVASAADIMAVSKRKGGLSARRSYGRSHTDRYAKKTRSSQNSGCMSKGKTAISLGISPTFSFGARKKLSAESGFRKSPEAVTSSNRNQIDDLLVDSDESVSAVPAKYESSTIKTARKRIIDSSPGSDATERKKRVMESDSDSEDEDF